MEIVRELKPKGIIVIPKDIRDKVKIREKDKIAFSVRDNEIIIKKQMNPEQWIKEFLKYRVKGKSPTPKELDKIYEESYDLS